MAQDSTGSHEGGWFHDFFHSAVAGSIILLISAIAALIWANSPWAESYFELANTYIGVSWGDAGFQMSLKHWINDGLMVLFFFVVGLEIKREIVVGELSSMKKSVLPVAAAIGGMVVPAVLYVAFNAGTAGASGWGIPMATDIAFALGILALFGSRAPIGLKVFLTALAIADDLGAVAVIALFYTEQIRWTGLIVAAAFLFVLYLQIQFRSRRTGLMFLTIIMVWAGVFASGIHATVAGIFLAFLVPVRSRIDPKRFLEIAKNRIMDLDAAELTAESAISDSAQYDAMTEIADVTEDVRPAGLTLEKYLHPTQSLIVLPLFAFFNAGVAINQSIFAALFQPVTLGIIVGLFVGKQIGILGASWIAIRSGFGNIPEGVNWAQIWGAGCLAGVGFTMSLFITELAFKDPDLISEAKIGIIAASLISGVCGYIILSKALPKTADD